MAARCLGLLAAIAAGAAAQSLSVSATPSAVTIYPGGQAAITVSVASDGYTGPVVVTLTGLPSGIAVSPLTLNGGGTGTLTLSAALNADQEAFPATSFDNPNTAVNTATVVAAVGSVQATAPLTLTVSLSNPAYAPTAAQINLPIVSINTNGVAVTSTTVDVPGTITITAADSAISYLPNASDSDNTAVFHVHGNSTALMPKLPYEFKLNTSLDLLNTMGLVCPYVTSSGKPTCDKSKTYVLLANYDDKTLLRDWSASALANAIPIGGQYLNEAADSPSPSGTSVLMPWAPHSLFVELYLNGVYEGNYQLIEKVNVDSHRINITELTDTDTSDVTGGYQLEIDSHEDEDYVFTTPVGLPIGMNDPDFVPEVPQQTSYISNYADTAENALFSSSFLSPTIGWRAYFDEASAVDFYIVNDLMGNVDGGNFFSSDYLYKNIDNPLLYMGPIWDFDISSGNVNYASIVNPTEPWMRTQAVWYAHWFQDPGFVADAATQWNTLKANGVLGTWLASIPQEAATLEQSQANNFERWPMQGVMVWPNPEAAGSYDSEVSYLTDWIRLRMGYLDSLFNSKLATTATLGIPSGTVYAGSPTTLTASVSGGSAPTGQVSFLANNILLGAAALDAGGQASLSTALPAGTLSVQAVYNGDNTNNLAISSTQTMTVASPLVATVTSLAGPTAASQGQSVTFTALVLGNSGSTAPTGTLTFSAGGNTLGTASLSGGIASFSTTSLPAGADSVQAVYSGDGTFQPSTSNSVPVQILATPSITWNAPTAITYGTPLSAAQLDATATVTGTFAYSPGLGTVLNAGSSETLSVTFTPTDTTDYSDATATTTVTVGKATLSLAAANATTTYGAAALPTFTGTIVGQQNGDTFTETFSTTATATSPTGTYPITPTAIGTNLADYSVAAITGTLTITAASQTITFAPLAGATYGAAPLPLVASASSGLPVTFTATGPAAVSVTPAGAMLTITGGGIITVTAAQGGNTDYSAAAPVSRSFTIAPEAQTITFAAMPATVPGAVVTLSATATSGLPVTFKVISGAATLSGNQLSVLGAGSITVEADQAGNANYLAAPAVEQSILADQPAVALSAATLTFGSQAVNTTSAAQTVIVTNAGTATLTFGSASGSGSNTPAASATGPFTLTTNCGMVAPGASCSVNVVFTPTAAGSASGTLALSDNAPGTPQTVTLSGSSIAPGVSLLPAVETFGSQPVGTTSGAQSLTVLNTGTAALAIASVAASGDFAVSGSCPAIAAGSSCSFNATFSPTATGARSGIITLTDNAGTQTVAANGFGSAPGIAIAPASLVFPATLVGSSSYAETIAVTNSGTAALTFTGATVEGDFGVSSTCGAALAAGASCVANLTYTPTLAGAETGSLVLNDSLGQQTVALIGTGLAPGVNLSANQVVFGGQLAGTTSSAQTVVLTNSGTGALTIASVVATAGFSDTTNCAGSLAAGASCSINIGFAPSAAGPLTGSVTVSDTAGTQMIAAAGVGTVPGLALAPAAASFGAQVVGTESAAQTLTLTNTGATALTLGPRTTTGDFLEADACPVSLAAGASCQISLAFAPTALGSRSGALAVSDTADVASTLAALSGTGTLPGITVAPGAVFFGSQQVGAASAAQTVTVTNSGTAALVVNAVTVSGDFEAGTNCTAAPLAPGANCVVSLSMTPTTAGTRTGTLSLYDNADGVHTVALSGAGQAAGVSLSPSALAFGSAPIPAASGAGITLNGTPQTAILTNTGTLPLSITAIAVDGDFSQNNTCGATVAAGASCAISISFAPTGLGHRTGSLTIANNSAAGTQTISLAGDGSPTGLTLTPAALNFGGGAVGTASAPQAATLSNASGSAINSLAITASGEFSQTNTCGTTLANGASCTISIVLTPLTQSAITGSISIAGVLADGSGSQFHADGLRPEATVSGSSLAVVALAGSGNPAAIQLSAATLSYAAEAVGTASAPQTITITNTASSAALTGLGITSTPDFPETTTCGTSLAAGANCTVAVAFDPTAAGNRTGSLTIAADGGLSAQVALSGAGTGGLLSVNPSSLAFGARPVGTTSAPQAITIGNTGAAGLSLQAITLAGGDFALEASTCGTLPQTLAANASCTLQVTYTPSTTGTSAGSLTIGAGSSGTAVIALSGSGNTQGLALSSTALTFAAQGVGLQSAAQTLTLTNQGAAAIGISSIAADGDFAETNNCPASLAAGASCAVQVTITPTAVGARAGAVEIVDAVATQTVTLAGTGANYTVTATGAAASVDAGGAANFQLAYTPGAFTGTVSLACSGLPNAATCSFAPASLSLTAGGAASSTTLTISTTSRATLPPVAPGTGPSSRIWLWALAGILAGLTLLLAAQEPRRRRNWAMAALMLGALAAAGCGGATNLPDNNDGTPAGTYTITVTSTAGAATQTTTVTLSVN